MKTPHALALAAGLALALSAESAWARESLGRPSLAGLSRIGIVIVTAAANTLDEAAVRREVETRLQRAGIVIDGESAAELLVNVSTDRHKAESGPCAFGVFQVTLSLREPVVLERDPGHSVGTITWRGGGEVARFSTAAPSKGLQDIVESSLSAFLSTIKSDTEAAARQ